MLQMKLDNRWKIYFKGSALFDPFWCREGSLVICDGQLSFSQRKSQIDPSSLLLDTFSKSSTLPWQNWQHTASWSFSRSFFPATIVFQFLYDAGPLATSSLAWPLRGLKSSLRSLKLVKLDSALVSMGFSGAFSSFSHFLYCSRSPFCSLLISKLTLCKTTLSSSFVLESRTKTDKLCTSFFLEFLF